MTTSNQPNDILRNDDATDNGQTVPIPGAENAMRAARTPVGVGLSPVVAQGIALLLIALGVLAVQDALARGGAISGGSWLRQTVAAADAVEAQVWMVAPFAAIALLGLFILPIAFRRRPRKAVALAAQTGVYLRTKDLATIVRSHVDGSEGVTDVHASASRQRLKITATSLSAKDRNAATTEQIKTRLEPVLAALDNAPKLSIDIRNEDMT